jgi:hypothetical protein
MLLLQNSSIVNWLSNLAEDSFYEFALILAFAAVLGMIGQLLKQPLIVMFIFLGIILGPSLFDIVKSQDNIHLLAEIGISILLFIVGLKLDLRIIKTVGKIALLTGLGQVLFTSLFGYIIGIALGFSPLHSFYIAVALTFSSTIIIVKLLSDKKEIDSFVDFSEYSDKLVKYAHQWAEKFESELLLLHAYEIVSPGMAGAENVMHIQQLTKEGVTEDLRKIIKDHLPKEAKARYSCSSKPLIYQLKEELNPTSFNFVFVGLKGTGSLKRIFLGS